MKSNGILKTLRTNWRDLLAFIIFGIGLSMVNSFTDYLGNRYGANDFVRLVTPVVGTYLQGLSRFVGAAASATIVWMMLWPVINAFGNSAQSYEEGWKALGPKGQFITYVSLICVALIAAAICFNP